MRAIKSKPIGVFPDFSLVKDEAVKEWIRNISDILTNHQRDTYDDVKAMQNVDMVDTLPTATVEYRGRMVILKGAGAAADKLYVGVKTGSATYGFEEITL